MLYFEVNMYSKFQWHDNSGLLHTEFRTEHDGDQGHCGDVIYLSAIFCFIFSYEAPFRISDIF